MRIHLHSSLVHMMVDIVALGGLVEGFCLLEVVVVHCSILVSMLDSKQSDSQEGMVEEALFVVVVAFVVHHNSQSACTDQGMVMLVVVNP